MKKLTHEQILFRIPFKEPAEWARARIEAAEHASAKIETDERIVGIGETLPRPTVYGKSIQLMRFASDNWLGPMIIRTVFLSSEAI